MEHPHVIVESVAAIFVLFAQVVAELRRILEDVVDSRLHSENPLLIQHTPNPEDSIVFESANLLLGNVTKRISVHRVSPSANIHLTAPGGSVPQPPGCMLGPPFTRFNPYLSRKKLEL